MTNPFRCPAATATAGGMVLSPDDDDDELNRSHRCYYYWLRIFLFFTIRESREKRRVRDETLLSRVR
jgi:hypothetical protein